VPLDEVQPVLARGEGGMRQHLPVEVDRGRHARAVELGQRAVHPPDRLRPGVGVHHHLGQQRVVVRRHLVPGVAVGVDPHARAARRHEPVQPAERAGPVVAGVLGVDPALDGVPARPDVVLPERQPLTGRHPDHPADQVDAGTHLGDRVLDLDAGVHLHEVELAGRVDQELHRAGAGVPHRAGAAHRGLAHPGPQVRGEHGGRRLLQQLLLAALDRAVALPQVHHAAVGVAEDLHLHVPRALDVLLQVHPVVEEHRAGHLLHLGQRRGQPLRAAHHRHPAPAAAGRRLQDHRVPHRGGALGRLGQPLQRPFHAGRYGQPGGGHQRPGPRLVAHRRDHGHHAFHVPGGLLRRPGPVAQALVPA
jgi:hypothetical protein